MTNAPRPIRPPSRLPDTAPVRRDHTDATCSHCNARFHSSSGMVTQDFSLCPVCDGRD